MFNSERSSSVDWDGPDLRTDIDTTVNSVRRIDEMRCRGEKHDTRGCCAYAATMLLAM